MNTLSPTTSAIAAAAATLLLGNNAFATAWGDSSQAINATAITSIDPNAPTVLRSVTVKCPKAGRLMAFGEAEFGLHTDTPPSVTSIEFSITKNSTAFDFGNYRVHSQYVTEFFTRSPAGMQRADSCTANQTVTYRFVAYRGGSSNSSTDAFQPRLNVIFVDTII